jgi:hypothetical protein
VAKQLTSQENGRGGICMPIILSDNLGQEEMKTIRKE